MSLFGKSGDLEDLIKLLFKLTLFPAVNGLGKKDVVLNIEVHYQVVELEYESELVESELGKL